MDMLCGQNVFLLNPRENCLICRNKDRVPLPMKNDFIGSIENCLLDFCIVDNRQVNIIRCFRENFHLRQSATH